MSDGNEIQCLSCNAELPSDAKVCVACGFHRDEQRHLATAINAPLRPAGENPYVTESDLGEPRARGEGPGLKSYDLQTRVSWLEERVQELEQRVRGTSLTSPSFVSRLLAVMALWLIGATILAGIGLLAVFVGSLLAG